MSGEINNDPIHDIRVAVASVLRAFHVPGDHKRLTDSVVDELPSFFRNSMRLVDSSALSDDLTNMICDGIRRSAHSTREEWQAAVDEILDQ